MSIKAKALKGSRIKLKSHSAARTGTKENPFNAKDANSVTNKGAGFAAAKNMVKQGRYARETRRAINMEWLNDQEARKNIMQGKAIEDYLQKAA